MKLFYYPGNNFGDKLNAWLWERVIPGIWDENKDVMVSGIGTIISGLLPCARKWIICSSGVGYGPPPEGFGGANWDILCVRGPLSAKVLGLEAEKAITDGAICLSFLPEYAPLPEEQRHGIVFMPHHKALEKGRWKEACDKAGIEFLDPTADDKEILARIRTAKLVIADAMHAAIVADTLRVPWVPVVSSTMINTFKWLDWTLSMSLPYEPIVLPQSSCAEALQSWFWVFRGEKFYLDDKTPEAAIRHFNKMKWIKAGCWWTPIRKAGNLTYRIANFFIKYIGSDKDDLFLMKAANALSQAANSKIYLSNNAIFEKRRNEMSACLEKIRFFAEKNTKENI